METVRKEWGRQKEGMRTDSIDRVSGESKHRLTTGSDKKVKTVKRPCKKTVLGQRGETLKTG